MAPQSGDLRGALLMREPQSFGIGQDPATGMGSQLFNSFVPIPLLATSLGCGGGILGVLGEA
jgi:hypothetical protein